MSVTPDQRFLRFREAYLLMAKEARYRPKAPSDGFGHIVLSLAEQLDQKRLEDEAGAYAAESARLCEQYARTRARRATEIQTFSRSGE